MTRLEQVFRAPFFVRCRECNHVWIAAYLPLPVEQFARIASRLHCPMCAAGANRIVVSDGTTPPPLPTPT